MGILTNVNTLKKWISNTYPSIFMGNILEAAFVKIVDIIPKEPIVIHVKTVTTDLLEGLSMLRMSAKVS